MADLTDQSKILSAEDVERLHRNADTDTRRESLHHTIGPKSNQAAAGDHRHDGTDSSLLFTEATITGNLLDGTALASVIAILVSQGATDATA